jgi:putative ABC transport system permease protein
VLSAGVHLARRGRSGALVQESTALIGVAAAIAVGIAAVSLAASFDDLVNTPERFGATWDLSMSGSSLSDDATQPTSDEGVRDQIAAAAAITGADFDVDGETAWIHAFAPIDGIDDVVPLPISEGRAPADGEIALGEITLRKIGKTIGDSVTITSPATGEHQLKVVGVAIINDTFEASPGRGGVVTPEVMTIVAPEASGDPVVLDLKPGADVDDVTRRLGAIYDGPVQPPVEQVALLNVGRVRYVPFVMAGVVALLAIASLVHALVLSVGRNRRPLGVLKSLGFTRAQVGGTVACQANAFGLVALVTAVPLGVFLGRQVWGLVAEQLGVPDVPLVPVASVATVVLVGLLVVNLVASYPAWRAARLPTATALRSE